MSEYTRRFDGSWRVVRNTQGISRTVYLVGRYAVKTPCARYGWSKFLHGMLANLQERAFGRGRVEGFCPVLFADPLGLVVVMPRVRVLTEPLSEEGFHAFVNRAEYINPAENKPDSFGYLNGALVAIDYGN